MLLSLQTLPTQTHEMFLNGLKVCTWCYRRRELEKWSIQSFQKTQGKVCLLHQCSGDSSDPGWWLRNVEMQIGLPWGSSDSFSGEALHNMQQNVAQTSWWHASGPNLIQLSSAGPKEREQMFALPGRGLQNCSYTSGCSTSPVDTAAPALESWTGFGP